MTEEPEIRYISDTVITAIQGQRVFTNITWIPTVEFAIMKTFLQLTAMVAPQCLSTPHTPLCLQRSSLSLAHGIFSSTEIEGW
jgi:hypothetical protein